MKQHHSHAIGKRAIAAVLSVSLMTTGMAVTTSAVATAQNSQDGIMPTAATVDPTYSITCDSFRRGSEEKKGGLLSIDTDATVHPGGLLQVHATEFTKRDSDGELGVKINDGNVALPKNQEGADVTDVTNGTGFLVGEKLPPESGTFDFTVRLPEIMEPGDYWLRVLGGNDGGSPVSTYVWFQVTAKPGEEDKNKLAIDDNPVVGGDVFPGGLLPIKGSGFAARPAVGGKLNVKGGCGFSLDENQEGSDVVVKGEIGTLKNKLPSADGDFAFAVRVPDNLKPGTYRIRVLGGSDDGDTVFSSVDFTVPEPSLTASESVEAGELLTVTGQGFAPRPEEGFLGIKLEKDKKNIPLPQNQEGADVTFSDNGAVLQGDKLPTNAGTFSFKVRVPSDIDAGNYQIRVLGGKDGGVKASTATAFTVTKQNGGGEVPVTQAAVTAEDGYTSSRNGSVNIPVGVTGFPANAEISVIVNNKAAKWAKGRRDTVDTITTDENGAAEGTVRLAKGELNAGIPVVVKVQAKDEQNTSAESNEVIVNPAVELLSSTIEGLDDSAQNSTVKVQVSGLPKGATVTFVGVADTNFLSGDQKGVSNDDALAEITGVKIPGTADLLGKPIIVKYTIDETERTYKTYYTVTPDSSLFGTEKYTVEKAELDPGLYQVRFNHKNGKLYVARTDRSANKAGTRLMIVNPDTLKVEKEIEPAATNDNNAQVFGVGLDEQRNRVWTTNSTADSVAVYDTDLKLVHQFPAGVVSHGRDVVVDESTGLAYVGSPRSDAESLTVFNADTKSYELLPTPGFSGAMTLRLDQKTGDLYSVSQNAPKAMKVNVRTKAIEVYDLPEDKVDSASGLAIDPATGFLYIASQDTHNVVVFDPAKKAVVADIPTGDQALSVVYDPSKKLIYTANRTAGTVTVIDPKTNEKVANLDAGVYPNDLEADDKGRIFVTNKVSRTGANKDGFFRFTPVDPTPDPEQPGDTSSVPNPFSPNSMPKLLTGFLVTFGVIGGLAALFGFLAKIGIIPIHTLPVGLRNLLHI